MTNDAVIANKAGIDAHVLSQTEVQNLEPHTKVNVIGGVFYPGDAHLNPNLLISGLKKHLLTEGVKFYFNTTIQDFEIKNKQVTGVLTADEKLDFDEIVIATGAWSGVLSEKLGISLPLQGGKGYSMLFEGLGEKVNIPAIMLEARATATPMGSALRCAGTMEIAGLDLSVNMNRVKGIVKGVNSFYPELPVNLPKKEAVWRGLRPCSPDGLPYIGRIEHLKNVTIATGHGMMGLSLGPATGKLVSEIISNTPLSIAVNLLNPMRF